MFKGITDKLKLEIRIQFARKYRTIMSPSLAAPHHKFAKLCQKKFSSTPQVNETIDKNVKQFKEMGFTEVWSPEQENIANNIFNKVHTWERENKYWKNGTIEITSDVYNELPELEQLISVCFKEFLTKVFNSEYKVFFARILKTSHDPSGPSGSQLWHQDGGPGSALNALFYLRSINSDEGAIELISWDDSLKLFKIVSTDKKLRKLQKNSAPRTEQRQRKVEIYEELIEKGTDYQIYQPTGSSAGLLVPFQNNLIHKGGYPKKSQKDRYALIFYFYPSDETIPLHKYKKNGFPKTASYPKNPKF